MNTLSLLEEGGLAASTASNAEAGLRALLSPLHAKLGRRDGSLTGPDGAAQFFAAGAFILSPDREYHMLTASLGFPAEQSRLMIPLTGGHPGRVYDQRSPLFLPDTGTDRNFRQYLKTARMGTAIYVPMLWQDRFLGQIILAGLARSSLTEHDFAAMRAAAPVAAAVWIAKGGDNWLQAAYPPEDGFKVPLDGL